MNFRPHGSHSVIFWYSLYTEIFTIFSQPSICRTSTRVCWHVAQLVAGELPEFLPYISCPMTACIMRFILFIIFWHSMYTDIFIIFSQPSICRTGTGVFQHVAVQAASKLLTFFTIHITWYYEIYFVYYLPAFSVYWHFYYFFTTQHLQNRHWSVLACGCAGLRLITGIIAIYITWHT